MGGGVHMTAFVITTSGPSQANTHTHTHTLSGDARQLSMRCTYGFLALHLPLGDHVLFYASGTVD